MATRLNGYAATWLRGYVATRLRGYAATWLRGYPATRLPGYAATRLPIHSGEDLWKAFLKDIKKIYKFEKLDNASYENNKVIVSNEQCENEFQEA